MIEIFPVVVPGEHGVIILSLFTFAKLTKNLHFSPFCLIKIK